MNLLRLIPCIATLVLTGCGTLTDGWINRWTEPSAKDRIMLVRTEPPSFGHRRLLLQARLYPDLALFLGQHGLPGFIAEITNRERHYIILYYLTDRQAFACRTKGKGSQQIEFSGPYPITQREYKTLQGYRHQAERARSVE
jgi:hypothetical protein